MSSSELANAVEQYKRGAAGTSHRNAKQANASHDSMHEAFKLLRESDTGRRMISSLIQDDNPHVRTWAASHSLGWNPALGIAALEAIRDSGGPCSFDAEMTLKEYGKGRLTFDY